MNRRNKPITKKLDFEPKIPTEEEVLPILKTEEQIAPKQPNQEPQVMKGAFAPRFFATSKEANLEQAEFLINLPDFFQEECTLVVFNDNSFGVRMDGKIYECDGLFLGDTMVVEMDDKVRKIGTPDLALTVYPYEKEHIV